MKVGDLVIITTAGQYTMPSRSEGDKAIVLKVYEPDRSCPNWKCLKGQQLYRIAMFKDGCIIDCVFEKEIKKFE